MTPEELKILMDSLQVVSDTSTRLQNEYTIQVLTVIMTSLTTLGVATLAYLQNRSRKSADRNHDQFNSRMDELKEAWKDAAFKAGQKQEQDDQRGRE